MDLSAWAVSVSRGEAFFVVRAYAVSAAEAVALVQKLFDDMAVPPGPAGERFTATDASPDS